MEHKGIKKIATTIDAMQKLLNDGFYIDISKGCEKHTGLKREDFLTCVRTLTSKGYPKDTCYIEHVNGVAPEARTKIDIIAPKGATATDIWEHMHEAKIVKI